MSRDNDRSGFLGGVFMCGENDDLSPEPRDEEQARLGALRVALQAGEYSGVAEGDVFEEVRSYIRQWSAEEGRN
jgi:hypothetical protein